jgi:DNA-binding beta-propeller fold protein YncE
MASFINYDYANEYLVYAHGAPGIKLMMQQIDDISRRTTDGMNIKFAWGGNAWPVTWYFRHLTNATFFAGNPTPQALKDAVVVYASDDVRPRVEPLLEDNYYKFEYIRMWWPDQEYFYLTPERVENALDFSSDNTQAAEIRRGMFDIWWKRDYTEYGVAINKDYSLQNWPVSERFYVYVRKDVAAQVWNLGTGDVTVQTPAVNQTNNICTSNWQQKPADTLFTLPEGVTLNHPLDIAVDDANNRVYVADTWNFNIREFTPQGSLVRTWGQAGQYGADAQKDPTDGLWGPRDVAVDANGNVYVSDTGNKRIRVYDANGNYLRDIGSAGSALGQLDEPSGLAIDNADGLLYVADTWNKRISVFDLDGNPKFTFDVRGWFEDLGNRPYLAIDSTRHLLYVTDPDAGRILVYDLQGNCVGSFGQPTDTPTDLSQFTTVGGITTDADGNVYVDDASAGRVLKFTPFVDQIMPAPQSGGLQIILPPQQGAATGEVTPEAASTLDLEVTAEPVG